jgi:3-oxoacyl-[acyl-carrier-protein] synthase-1/3-oxoacyl-[acyl-carrier-protein] synthase II
MVLEAQNLRLSSKPARGYVRGYGTATDAHHLTAPHPEARGLRKALSDSLAQAGADGRAVAFINAHGTATPTNDAAEGAFFRRLFPLTPFIATKGCTGHTLGAAGAVEAVFTLAHLAGGRLPASPGFAEPDPDIGVAPVRTPTNLDGELALSQSLAFGGNNSILLLGKGERRVD